MNVCAVYHYFPSRPTPEANEFKYRYKIIWWESEQHYMQLFYAHMQYSDIKNKEKLWAA